MWLDQPTYDGLGKAANLNVLSSTKTWSITLNLNTKYIILYTKPRVFVRMWPETQSAEQ